MNNKIILILLSIVILFSGCNSVTVNNSSSFYRTAAACAVAGAKISVKDQVDKKYKRKDCPVCKGKGWYMSGDGIEKIPCQYCEPESSPSQPEKPSGVIIRRR